MLLMVTFKHGVALTQRGVLRVYNLIVFIFFIWNYIGGSGYEILIFFVTVIKGKSYENLVVDGTSANYNVFKFDEDEDE